MADNVTVKFDCEIQFVALGQRQLINREDSEGGF